MPVFWLGQPDVLWTVLVGVVHILVRSCGVVTLDAQSGNSSMHEVQVQSVALSFDLPTLLDQVELPVVPQCIP